MGPRWRHGGCPWHERCRTPGVVPEQNLWTHRSAHVGQAHPAPVPGNWRVLSEDQRSPSDPHSRINHQVPAASRGVPTPARPSGGRCLGPVPLAACRKIPGRGPLLRRAMPRRGGRFVPLRPRPLPPSQRWRTPADSSRSPRRRAVGKPRPPGCGSTRGHGRERGSTEGCSRSKGDQSGSCRAGRLRASGHGDRQATARGEAPGRDWSAQQVSNWSFLVIWSAVKLTAVLPVGQGSAAKGIGNRQARTGKREGTIVAKSRSQ